MSDVRFGRECINWRSEWTEVNETFKPAEDVFGWLSIFGSNLFFRFGFQPDTNFPREKKMKICVSLIGNFFNFIFTTSTARGLNIYLIFAGLKQSSRDCPTKFQLDMRLLRRRKIGFINVTSRSISGRFTSSNIASSWSSLTFL